MRAWLLAPVIVIACSIDLEPLVTGSDDGGAGQSIKDGSVDGCAFGNCGATGGSAANGGTGAVSGLGGTSAGASGAAGAAMGGVGGKAGASGVGGAGGVGGSTGGAGGTSGSGNGGSGQTFACFNVYQIQTFYAGDYYPCDSPSPATCTCHGCYPVCEDQYGPVSDCVCPVCTGQCGGCVVLDGLCDPYAEDCLCPDCYAHPLCK